MTNGKNIVCNLCSRHFKSNAALLQHRSASHGGRTAVLVSTGNASNKPMARRPARRARRKNAGGIGSAPVSTAMMITGSQSDSAQLRGVDRIAQIDDVSKFTSGQEVVNVLIVPALFARLKTVALAFQKVTYLNLRFRVEPQISTATSGGYVAAFVRDPADEVPKNNTLAYLTSQQGSKTTKWWAESVVTTSLTKRVYYTSDGVEIREYSPGRFVLAVDGKATQTGNLTVFCEWSVTLSSASLENPKSVTVEYTVVSDLFTRSDSSDSVLYARGPGGWIKEPINQLIAGVVPGNIMKTPFPIMLQSSETVRQCWYLNVQHANGISLARESGGDIAEPSTTENLVLPQGTVLELVNKRDFRLAESRSEDVEKTVETTSGDLRQLMTDLRRLQPFLRNLSTLLLKEETSCPLQESLLSMDSMHQRREVLDLADQADALSEYSVISASLENNE